VVLYGGAEFAQRDAMYELTPDGWNLLCDNCLGAANAVGAGGRDQGGFAYDPRADRFLLFGGADPSANLSNDLWEYAGGAWGFDGAAPVTPRTLAQLVFDPVLGGMRLLGGYDADGPKSDVWTFVNGSWSQEPDSPPALFSGEGTEATYDADHDRVLALAERPGDVDSDEVWQHTADGWSLLCESCTGAPRHAASIVHLADYDQTFIIGGASDSDPTLNGTWVLVGDHFERLDTFNDIDVRWNAGVVYDPSRDVVVLYGGYGCGNGDGPPRPPPAACSELWELVRDEPTQ